jgi:hypothetical protein
MGRFSCKALNSWAGDDVAFSVLPGLVPGIYGATLQLP